VTLDKFKNANDEAPIQTNALDQVYNQKPSQIKENPEDPNSHRSRSMGFKDDLDDIMNAGSDSKMGSQHFGRAPG
jgi:hypothetical protein